MSRCTWTATNGEPCRFPGTLSDGLKGDGRWMCPHHFRSNDQAASDEIVARSIRWSEMPNRQDAWIESRRRQVYGDTVPPLVARLREILAARGKTAAPERQREAA